MLKQLTTQDASFLYLETAETPEHVGGLSAIELPAGHAGDFYEDYKATIASRIDLVPFMHSKLVELPLDVDQPFWVEDEHVDIDYHIRRATVPRPGGIKELEALVGLLHAHPLDRSRPLWEFYVIDGLASGQPAVYTKVHHAAMDGAASQALMATLYDPTPTVRALPHPATDDAENRGDAEHIVEGLLAHLLRQDIRAAQCVPELLKSWLGLLLPNARTLRYDPVPSVPRTPRTLLNVGITNQRVYAARTLPLSAVKQLAKKTGTKINDVVLAVCCGAVRAYLAERDALPSRSLTAMVPVSLRDAGDLTTANQNGAFLCNLASDVADPYQRLLAIHRSSLEQKKGIERWKNIPWPDLSMAGVGLLSRRMVELYGKSKLAERLPLCGNFIVSNVPGPASPLYVAGAKILSMYPCSIPFHGAALNITVESYCDRLDFGLIACRRAVPDLAHLADGLLVALEELTQAVAASLSAASQERMQS